MESLEKGGSKSEGEKTAEQKKEEMIEKLASLLHDEWRKTRREKDGSYKPRMKPVKKEDKDQEWFELYGIEEVDIANTRYEDLPPSWQEENREAAEVVINLVLEEVEKGNVKLDELKDEKFNNFVEKVSSKVHKAWIERRESEGQEIPADQLVPYEKLSEEEKEKDRTQVRAAIEIIKKWQKEEK